MPLSHVGALSVPLGLPARKCDITVTAIRGINDAARRRLLSTWLMHELSSPCLLFIERENRKVLCSLLL